ncbi:MAG: class I tRNA ligase family protein, partial [Actinomycetota bacterium]|nr:class I tRNA ligase family protein [Actinomycetota bacterium]
DALRVFHLFVGPPGDDFDWTGQSDEMIEGCSRFLQRVYRLATDPSLAPSGGDQRGASIELRQATHRTVDKVTTDYERWSYNTAVAALMALTNQAYKSLQAGADAASLNESVDAILKMLAPMAPHMTAEAWSLRHADGIIHAEPWPVADPALLVSATETMVVQVAGKVRDKIEVAVDISEDGALALALGSDKVRKALGSDKASRVIARLPRLINLIP